LKKKIADEEGVKIRKDFLHENCKNMTSNEEKWRSKTWSKWVITFLRLVIDV